ncbi:polysaccharide biosynthesis protein [Candidatus Woesearchaeota archaeon]|nr:polysaccharide biosynthesis protein [Candidatus Woesearchaeota archaeon]
MNIPLHIFHEKSILITGGLGSIGREILKNLLPFKPKQIRILDNRETELFHCRQEYRHEKSIRFLYGDVRDKERLLKASQGIDIIFHAAALKHVSLCEYDPYEAIKTNVLGTYNILESAMVNKVDKVILISTDKAVNPSNVMGTTKLLAERLLSSMYYHRGRSQTKFASVRFGNVLSSRGSVLEIWNQQLSQNKKITITDLAMTRFLMSIPDSVALIFYATFLAEEGETFILKMNSVVIQDLAEVFLELNHKPTDFYEIIGRKHGEKIHEDLIFNDERDILLENDLLFVRLPYAEDLTALTRQFKEKMFIPTTRATFSSLDSDLILDKLRIKELLLKQI